MEIKNLEKNNEIEINNNIANEKNQMEFLDTTLGKTINAAIESGGIIDGISKLLDTVVSGARDAGLINKNIANTIKQGKNVILNNVESNIEKTFNKQYKNFEYIDKYINNWKEYFEKKDFSGMEKEYKKIEIKLNEIAPIEKTINEAKQIGIIHNLIKNNGQDFNLSNEQLELAEKLI